MLQVCCLGKKYPKTNTVLGPVGCCGTQLMYPRIQKCERAALASSWLAGLTMGDRAEELAFGMHLHAMAHVLHARAAHIVRLTACGVVGV